MPIYLWIFVELQQDVSTKEPKLLDVVEEVVQGQNLGFYPVEVEGTSLLNQSPV